MTWTPSYSFPVRLYLSLWSELVFVTWMLTHSFQYPWRGLPVVSQESRCSYQIHLYHGLWPESTVWRQQEKC